MLRRIIRWLDPILLIGLFISIAISIGMVLTGNDSISGLTIGLLSTIITLLIDAIARIQKAETNLLEAAGLLRMLSDESLGESLQEIANNYEQVKKFEYDDYRKLANLSIEECRIRLREIASGSVHIPPASIQEAGFKEFERVQRDVKVIHAVSMDYWNTEFGKKYFRVNQAAIKRGVKITRIFALTDEGAKDNIEILKEQEKAGVRVVIMNPSSISSEYIIFDERILVYYDRDESGVYKAEYVILDSHQVKQKIGEFERLANHPYAKTVKDILLPSKNSITKK